MEDLRWARTARDAVLLSCTALTLGAGATYGQVPPLWDQADAGPHAVGFQRVWHVDPVRIWSRSAAIDSTEGTIGRPLRFDLWYPAETCGRAGRMPLRDYLIMESPSSEFDDLVFLTHRWDEYSYRGLAGDSTAFDRLMETRTAACPEAPAAGGSFPLVVYSAGWFNRAPDNTVLAELLASHGFVVAAVPQLNPGLWTYSFASDAGSIENQVRDLEVAIAVLREDPRVDRRRIAAMGYSTGGDVALLLQARNPLVDAVVGLDASWTLGPGNDVVESHFFRPADHGVPILAARREVEDPALSDQVLDTLTAAPRLVVEVPGSDHGTFSDDPLQRLLLGLGTEEHAATHTVMAQVVLDFLTEALRASSDEFPGQDLARRLAGDALGARFRPPESAPPDSRPPS